MNTYIRKRCIAHFNSKTLADVVALEAALLVEFEELPWKVSVETSFRHYIKEWRAYSYHVVITSEDHRRCAKDSFIEGFAFGMERTFKMMLCWKEKAEREEQEDEDLIEKRKEKQGGGV